jgi:acyl carrier protein
MEKKEIILELQKIFQDVFDNDEIIISNETVAEDIDEWDSLSHIELIKEIEKHFNVKISSKELFSWDNVGEMADSILLKL